MPIAFRCTHCHRRLSIARRKAGTPTECPLCGVVLEVPLSDEENSSAKTQILPPLPEDDIPVVLPVEEDELEAVAVSRTPVACRPGLVPARDEERSDEMSPTLFAACAAVALTVCIGLGVASYVLYQGHEQVVQAAPAMPVQERDPEPFVAPPPTAHRIDLPASLELKPKSNGRKREAPTVAPETPTVLEKPAKKPDESTKTEAPSKFVVVRRIDRTDEELRRRLLDMPELSLDVPQLPFATQMIVQAAIENRNRQNGPNAPATRRTPTRRPTPPTALDLKTVLEMASEHPTISMVASRPDLVGLPLRMGNECMSGKEKAEDLQVLSRKLRVQLEASIPNSQSLRSGVPLADPRPDPTVLRAKLLDAGQLSEWLQPEAIPAMQQLLMAENKRVRTVMVDMLSQMEDKRATRALVQRALFDLNPEVRASALHSLKARPESDYRDQLVEGFRYPFAPVAEHAAEAVATLKLKSVVPQLRTLLDEPNPQAPFLKRTPGGSLSVVREVVRINHLGNCLLCHAPSLQRDDLVRGAVPTKGQPLPAPATTPQYYDSGSMFVRADVTYLHQDFSVVQPVERPNNWPSNQRFDYLVRVRPATAGDRLTATPDQPSEYQQSVMFALRELTGANPGNKVQDWKSYLAQ